MNWQEFMNWLRSLFGQPGTNTNSTSPGSSPTPVPVSPVPAVPVPTPVPVAPVPAAPVPVAPVPVVPTPVPVTPPPLPTPMPVTLPQEGPELGFGRLWKNHPNISDGEMFPCRRPDGVPNFGNQCAIRMGTCLFRSNLLKGYDGAECWFGHEGHTLRARELALWLRNHPSTFGKVEIRSGSRWQDYLDRTGIIYCQNFWGENNQGDHIDLWDGTGEFMGGGAFSWEGPAMAGGGLDYIERSEEVWFWPVH
ncbi:MAG TPA: T6SS effector amidase Tae4 family protein [Thiolinea sp.]|nr:T6SS effector amidase Tae4 family protein [Thiolinea sp.]